MAKQRRLATSTTSAITDGNQVAFSLQSQLFKGGRSPIVSVKGLAGVETVTFWLRTYDTWEELADSAGTQQVFTATRTADTFNTPGVFGYTKSATAGAISIYVTDAR